MICLFKSQEYEDPPTGREIQMSTGPSNEGKSGGIYPWTSKKGHLEREHLSHLPSQTIHPILYHSRTWVDTSIATMTICTTITQLSSNGRVAYIIRCNEARAYCEDMYPQEAWTQAYTDGSATKAVADGGAGVYISFPDSTVIIESIPTGINCSNYKAEVQALLTASQMVETVLGDNIGRLYF